MVRYSAFLFTLLLPAGLCAAEPFTFPDARLAGKGELRHRNGLPVLVVSGTPEEMGTAVGALAIKPSPRPLQYPRELLSAFGADRFWPFLVQTGKGLYRNFPEPYKQELEAMGRSAGVPRETLLVGNTMFDVKKVLACSAVLVEPQRSATGGPLLGRNLDYPSLGYIHQYTLVTVYRPRGKHAFAAVGFPGLVGCLSGMNDAGLAVSILEVMEVKDGEPRFNADGVPYALCYRRLLEECTTIAEAKKLLEGMKRTTLTNLVLADRTGVAVFEVTPTKVVERDATQGLAVCTNHFCTPQVCVARPINVARTLDRYAALEEVRKKTGKVSVADVQDRLNAANLGNETLQTMVFEPKTLKLHLAFGQTPASAMPLKTLDLGPLFQGK
jgi:isopenicillin-N N-acyltransferase-like protein